MIVDCSGKNLTQLPSFVPLARDAKEVHLNLSKNNLTSIAGAGQEIKNYTRVVQLDLSHNQVNITLYLSTATSRCNLIWPQNCKAFE